uniref:B30.2/SPRY domain-containing protein n=1 Tax=Globodera rostochiensis TaxID=31243 RepID=A0A914IAY8_GLORO
MNANQAHQQKSPPPPQTKQENLNLPNDATIFATIYEIRMKILDIESDVRKLGAHHAQFEGENIAQMEELKRQQSETSKKAQMFDKMMKCLLIQPGNRWNLNDRHEEIFLVKPSNCVIAQHHGTKKGFRSVRAESMVARQFGIFYYEVKVLLLRGDSLNIGLATKALPLDECVGRHKNSFSYANKGRFWKDGTVDGGNSKFGVDDVVGCGVNLATRQIFYALNGKRLYTAKAFDCPMDLFPCVSLEEPGDSVETNFGPNFKFNLADEFEELGWGK